MSWLEEMQADATKIAFGDKAQPGDKAEMNASWEEAWGYSSYTWDSAHFEVEVRIKSKNPYTSYKDEEASRFFGKLMEAGTNRGVNE